MVAPDNVSGFVPPMDFLAASLPFDTKNRVGRKERANESVITVDEIARARTRDFPLSRRT